MRLALVALLLAACSHNTQKHPETKTDTNPLQPARVDGGTSIIDPGSEKPAAVDPTAVTLPQLPPNVKIVIHTTPSKGVLVSWGKKKLGVTPLTVERPRNSGPVDLVLRYQGYIPVHTRAYTVKNDSIGVKMVKVGDRMTVFGAKQEIIEAPTDPLDPANAVAPAPGAPAPAPPPAP